MIGGGSPMIAAPCGSELASHWDATPSIMNYLPSDPRTIKALENAGIAAEEYTQFVKSLRKKK
jgi:hypothetical protein